MMRRWPIRIRLTAAFTTVMALVLLGVAVATIAHTRESLDAAITESLSYQLADLRPIAATDDPLLPGGEPDTAQQIIAPNGQILASTPNLDGQPALSPAELDIARHGQLVTDHPRLGRLEGPARIAAAAIPGGRVVAAAESLADRDAAVADLRNELAIGFPIVLAAAALGAYLLAAAALRPVERMRARAATISDTDPQARLPVSASRDEINRLGTTFNELLQRLQTALERERQFVTDAGHELRTPLTLLTTELELALRRPRSNPELTAALRSALDETSRLSRLARDLLTVADTSHHTQPPTIELRTHLYAAADRYRHTLGAKLQVDCPTTQHVRIEPDDLDRIIGNLIDNATEHGAPPITVHALCIDGAVEIRVHDHGPGFNPDFLPHAFDRFTRADTARTTGGTGLGLAIVDTLGDKLQVDCPTTQHVRIEPDDLDRIIGNLIDNATEHGAPPITVHAPCTAGAVEIRVHDHGPGFNPDFLPHAFDRFTRADTARTTGGTGLGLAIVDTLTRRNHGTATIRNHPDGGAEVTIQLPAARDQPPTPERS